jgi:hypothetical protein
MLSRGTSVASCQCLVTVCVRFAVVPTLPVAIAGVLVVVPGVLAVVSLDLASTEPVVVGFLESI